MHDVCCQNIMFLYTALNYRVRVKKQLQIDKKKISSLKKFFLILKLINICYLNFLFLF